MPVKVTEDKADKAVKETESKATRKPKMVRMWVTRQQVPIYKTKGFVPVAGEGPNGYASQGDAVLMEIPAKIAAERRKQVREPYERIRDRIRQGESPVGQVNSPYAEFVYERKRLKANGR